MVMARQLNKPRVSSALFRTSLQSTQCPNMLLQHQEGTRAWTRCHRPVALGFAVSSC